MLPDVYPHKFNIHQQLSIQQSSSHGVHMLKWDHNSFMYT